jgi:hypothetical protein
VVETENGRLSKGFIHEIVATKHYGDCVYILLVLCNVHTYMILCNN